jgi:hypothetical protein
MQEQYFCEAFKFEFYSRKFAVNRISVQHFGVPVEHVDSKEQTVVIKSVETFCQYQHDAVHA